MEAIKEAGAVASAIGAILALISPLIVKLYKLLKRIDKKLDGLSEDVGDLQYERLSQAQDFYVSRGWCPGAKKEMLIKMHKSCRSRGRNHLSEHYEDEILRLPDKPQTKGEEST